MGGPDRTVGLPYHLFYPILSSILLAIAGFSSADSVWYVSINTQNEVIRFGSQNYCGYNVSNLITTNKLGCIFRGFQYQLPNNYFGFEIPNDINLNLSKVALTSVISFGLVLFTGIHHAYTIRYSFRKNPIPNQDKLYTLSMIHFISVSICFLLTWVAFIVQAAIIGHAVSQSNNIISNNDNSQEIGNGVAIYWGQSVWLVLASAVIHFGWGYEAVRWRVALLK
ncbi:uncharacterized protein I206_104339 [Kwoniella pini CBS 10737]|uniref:Uncharacterized protein n=1 Tax=Kwoniella pini CBS 10737 TaxID=1296096 RepID=A0A1B9I286_9TREE|nr:uncharacterized protein I206_04083 [Kwoniella pini CBS 10737]OCF49561.1 hypothetical protein I206_04083 [Kwoniella pini CBS 10737]